MGWLSRKRQRRDVEARVLPPFYERWSADPSSDVLIDESLAWQYVAEELESDEEKVFATAAYMEFPDLGGVPRARGHAYLTDRAVMTNMSLTENWQDYVTQRARFDQIGYAGPSRFSDGTFSIAWNDDDSESGVSGWFLRFEGEQEGADFRHTFLTRLKEHGGYQGPPPTGRGTNPG